MKLPHPGRMPSTGIAMCLLLLQSCARREDAPAHQFTAEDVIAAGHTKAVRTSGTVARALDLCNPVLAKAQSPAGHTGGIRLVNGWQKETAASGKGMEIPVYLIHSQRAAASLTQTLAWIRVPEGRAAILIEEEAMDEALNGAKAAGSETTLAIKGEECLAVMLLHEAGHIANGDYGAFTEAVPVDLSSFNLHENVEKSREFKADAFAAQALGAAMKDTGGEFEVRLAAMTLGMCLSSWSFNLSKERLLDNFGATALNRPAVFWDKGNSHPNMELRILTILHLLMGDKTSAGLLDDFLAHRRAGSMEPRILWQKP